MKEESIISILGALGIDDTVTNGDWVNCSCPYAPYTSAHGYNNDEHPSFGVHIEDDGVSIMHCWACGSKGTLTKLARDLAFHHKENYTEVVKASIEADMSKDIDVLGRRKSKRKKVEPLPEQISEEWFSQTFPPVSRFPAALRYLESRGVTSKAIEKADLRYSTFESRVVVPVRHHNNKLYGYSGRSILKEEDYPVYENGKPYPKIRDKLKKKHFILGIDKFTDKPILVFEGLVSYIYLISIGADELVDLACVFGANLSDAQANLLIQYNRPVYLLYDNDAGGDKALFGAENADGTYSGGGAIDKLINSIPVYVPEWPDFPWYEWKDGEAVYTAKEDVDTLTIANVKYMLENTLRYDA